MTATATRRARLDKGFELTEGQVLTDADLPTREERVAEEQARAEAERAAAVLPPATDDPGIVLDAPTPPVNARSLAQVVADLEARVAALEAKR